ncbi:hypothetical protein [Peribacillus frigoritolerans]|uniref:hypothetical protein n=1 Tax=Peribacillus frigoritolerans TaxID=450367 RepID=UPI000FD933C0|nr:hypothetical protein [Peribacillus frigoritolerans]AZV62911.1 hypothetical protein DOZ91_21830 [Peribacillus frigoritolerans]
MVNAEGNSYLSCFSYKVRNVLYKKKWIEPFGNQGDYLFFYSFKFIWTPNALIRKQSIDALENVVIRLRAVELEELGELARRR